jgi:hypothetical protein
MPFTLEFAILDFAALMGLALASNRSGYRAGSVALAVFAAVVLAWGIVTWLMGYALAPPIPPR